MNFETLREMQKVFEANLQGTDGTLEDLNDVKHSLERGILGEGGEALEALMLFGIASEEFRNEVIDIWVFFGTLLNHIGMSKEELEDRTRRIVTKNFIKYHPRNFEGRTVQDGVAHSRSIWNKEDVVQQNSIVLYQAPVTSFVSDSGAAD